MSPSDAGRASTVYCLRPAPADTGWAAIHLAARHRIAEAFGPRINVVSLPKGAVRVGRAGLTRRSAYEINLVGHGLLIFGGGPPLVLEPDAIEALDVPVALFGFTEKELLGWDPNALEALAKRAVVAVGVGGGALGALFRAGAPDPVLGGPPGLFTDRVVTPAATLRTDALIVARNPADMHLPDTGTNATRPSAISTQIRALARHLRVRHADTRLLCQSPDDLNFAAAFPELNYVYTEEPQAWLTELRAAKLVVSYQITASMVCAGAGVPFVHLTADEAEVEQLDALGLGAWRVDLSSEEDVIDAIDRLVGSLEAQEVQRLSGLARWSVLDRTASEAMTVFAQAVNRYREIEVRERRANAFLPAAPTQALAVESTRVDMPVLSLNDD